MIFSPLNRFLVLLPLLAHLHACQKSSVTSQNQGAGGGVGGGETLDLVDMELSGSVSEEDPGDFSDSSLTEAGGSFSLTASSGFDIKVLSLSPQGQKSTIHEESSASSSFSLKFKAPKRYMILEVLRRADSRKFRAMLPPPSKATAASVRLDKTSNLAGVIAENVRVLAAAGDQAALAALSNQSISVADVVKVAQSVRRTVDEQMSQNSGAAINLSVVTSSLLTKSNERLSDLESAGLSSASIAGKISETTYKDLFGDGAENIPPGVLAQRVGHDLGASATAS